MDKTKNKAKDYVCIDCQNIAVAWFPNFQDTPSYPYCYKCLKKYKKELITKITSSGRSN